MLYACQPAGRARRRPPSCASCWLTSASHARAAASRGKKISTPGEPHWSRRASTAGAPTSAVRAQCMSVFSASSAASSAPAFESTVAPSGPCTARRAHSALSSAMRTSSEKRNACSAATVRAASWMSTSTSVTGSSPSTTGGSTKSKSASMRPLRFSQNPARTSPGARPLSSCVTMRLRKSTRSAPRTAMVPRCAMSMTAAPRRNAAYSSSSSPYPATISGGSRPSDPP